MIEKSAKGVKGFLLYDPRSDERFFRIYDEYDKGKFTDYALVAEDISVVLEDTALSLFETEDGNRLDWSSKYLGR